MNAGKIIESIVKYGPILVEAAGVIYGNIKKHFFTEDGSTPKPSSNLENLSERIYVLEKNEVEQAELVQKMASQLNDISIGLKVLYERIVLSLICSGVAILLSIIAIIFCLLK